VHLKSALAYIILLGLPLDTGSSYFIVVILILGLKKKRGLAI
jgi:hypothetical protein